MLDPNLHRVEQSRNFPTRTHSQGVLPSYKQDSLMNTTHDESKPIIATNHDNQSFKFHKVRNFIPRKSLKLINKLMKTLTCAPVRAAASMIAAPLR